MRNLTKITLAACIGLTLGIGQAVAGPKPDQLDKLRGELTPMGSERAGNAEGRAEELREQVQGLQKEWAQLAAAKETPKPKRRRSPPAAK